MSGYWYRPDTGQHTVAGVRIDLGRKICRQYHDKGSCRSAHGKCKFWHICKGFIEENCDGKCNRSHNFLDEENHKKTNELGLAKHPNGTIRHFVFWSLPQVCELYTRGMCASDSCLYLHICSQAVRSSACSCSLSHNLTDSHNMKILQQYDLVRHQSMSTVFVRCNILVPKEQRVLHKAHDFLPCVCNVGKKSSYEAMGVIQGTDTPSLEASAPYRHETPKSPFQRKVVEPTKVSKKDQHMSSKVGVAASAVKIVINWEFDHRYTTGRPSVVCVNLGLKKVIFIGISNVPNVFYQRKWTRMSFISSLLVQVTVLIFYSIYRALLYACWTFQGLQLTWTKNYWAPVLSY